MKKRPNLLAGEKLPPEPRQKRSLDKRERLKEAGLALFGEKGYESTSIDEIARRANFPVGSFYQHYRSKRQLLLALMDELLEKLGQLEFRPQAAKDPISVRARTALAGVLARPALPGRLPRLAGGGAHGCSPRAKAKSNSWLDHGSRHGRLQIAGGDARCASRRRYTRPRSRNGYLFLEPSGASCANA